MRKSTLFIIIILLLHSLVFANDSIKTSCPNKTTTSYVDYLLNIKIFHNNNEVEFFQDEISFITGKTKLYCAKYSTLDKLAITLSDTPNLTMFIEVHTDTIGSSKVNKLFSLKRAKELKKYFSSWKISSDKIIPIGRGEDYPIGFECQYNLKDINNRIDITLK